MSWFTFIIGAVIGGMYLGLTIFTAVMAYMDLKSAKNAVRKNL